MDNKQEELDAFETAVFKMIFGDGYQNNKTFKLASVVYGNKINAYISQFEAFMRPLMLDSGMVDAQKIRNVISVKYPEYANLLPANNFRLVSILDIIKTISGIDY